MEGIKMKINLWRITLIFLLLGGLACKDQITNEVIIPDDLTITPKEQKLTEVGWKAFKNGDLPTAKSNFLLAINTNSFYADAYNGLGWVYARIDSLDLSLSYFTLGENWATNNNLLRDIYAGRSFVNLALDYYADAISDVNNTLNPYYYNVDKYVFRYDLSITETDLLLVEAESWFLLGEYQNCYETLLIIDDTLEISASNPEELATVIENLREIV